MLTAHGGGTNISNLNQGILRDLRVPMPTFEEQRKIASVLSAYDDLIETTPTVPIQLTHLLLVGNVFVFWDSTPDCDRYSLV